jgi:uncharacterized protein (DUF2147 family)
MTHVRAKLGAYLLAMPLLCIALPAAEQHAADAVIGLWKTFDDETGKPMSITEVYRTKTGGVAARVVKTLNKPNATCDKCPGDRKGKPIAGMIVFWDMKHQDGEWGGKGFKPSTGLNFTVKHIQLVENGRKLEITGCKFVFCRTVTWERVK